MVGADFLSCAEEIFKLSAWGLDKKEKRERVEKLLCLAALYTADLVKKKKKNKNQGNSANQLATKLETLFKNNAANLNTTSSLPELVISFNSAHDKKSAPTNFHGFGG